MLHPGSFQGIFSDLVSENPFMIPYVEYEEKTKLWYKMKIY